MIAGYATYFLNWLLGKPLKTKLGKCIEGVLLGLLATVLVLASVFGPLAIFMPFIPPGFSSVTDGRNTVYFQNGDRQKAEQVLRQTGDAMLAVLRFWEGPSADRFPGEGVRVYLCHSSQTCQRLSTTRAAGSTIAGRAVFLDMRKQAIRKTTPGDLRHELSHLYLARHLGLFRSLTAVPRWFDEGCAASLGDLPWQTPRHLSKYLSDSPGLSSPSEMETHIDWHAMLSQGNAAQLKSYAHVRNFVDYLIEEHGLHKIREYVHRLSIRSSSADTFQQIFGSSLDESHQAWLSDMKNAGRLPRDTGIAQMSTSAAVRTTAVVVEVLVDVLIVFWLVRQISRVVRLTASFALRMTRRNTRESSATPG